MINYCDTVNTWRYFVANKKVVDSNQVVRLKFNFDIVY